jgi:hypothetical protein
MKLWMAIILAAAMLYVSLVGGAMAAAVPA